MKTPDPRGPIVRRAVQHAWVTHSEIAHAVADHFTHAGKSLALFTSHNGLDWKPTESPLISTTEITWADGRKQKLNSLERPQLWRSADGREAVLFCACDETKERTHSFNLAIPMELR